MWRVRLLIVAEHKQVVLKTEKRFCFILFHGTFACNTDLHVLQTRLDQAQAINDRGTICSQ